MSKRARLQYSGSSGPGPETKSGKRKKNGVERKYVSIQCTGYLKSWPCTKVGLGSDFSDQESGDESSLSCLVAVARLQRSFSESIEDCVERGVQYLFSIVVFAIM